jgi:holo-[acyl-carrier protein] synthase
MTDTSHDHSQQMDDHAVGVAGKVVSVGTDIIECDRISQMLDKHGQTFLDRVFTRGEIAYCQQRKMAYQHYAARWAAKEAVMKALGTGWSQGIQWIDVEMGNIPGGRPFIRLHGQAAAIGNRLGIDEILISVSHTKLYAVAFATAISHG